MGARTKIINRIFKTKKNILQAYARLQKNDSSCFDALAMQYGSEKLAQIVSSFGASSLGVEKTCTNPSEKIALYVATKNFGKNYIVTNLYSPYFYVADTLTKVKQIERVGIQQVFLCLANKDKIDIKRRFLFDDLLQKIYFGDIVLLDISTRKISLAYAQNLIEQKREQTIQMACNLQKYILPNLKIAGRKRFAINKQKIKAKNPKLFAELVKIDKIVAQKMFLFETSKEQLVLNDGLEEFSSAIYALDQSEVQKNFEAILQNKQKADKIFDFMQKNEIVLQKSVVETKSHTPSFANKSTEKIF